MSHILPHLLNGLSLGLLFALIALGFMLIVSVMEVINLAHGSLFALGAYFALVVIDPDFAWLGAFGEAYRALPLPLRYGLAFLVAPALVAIVGMGLEVCMRRTYGKKAEYGLLLTFGAALVIEETIRVLWGPSEQYLQVPRDILRRCPLRRADLLEVQALRGAVRGHRHRLRLALPRAHALRRHYQGRRA